MAAGKIDIKLVGNKHGLQFFVTAHCHCGQLDPVADEVVEGTVGIGLQLVVAKKRGAMNMGLTQLHKLIDKMTREARPQGNLSLGDAIAFGLPKFIFAQPV